MNTNDLAKAIAEKEKELWGYKQPYVRVSDIDKILICDLSQLHGLSFIPTRKDNKSAQINRLRTMIHNEEIEIHPRNKRLIHELLAGVWNKNKTDFEREEGKGHFDGVAALIYWARNLESIKYENPSAFGEGVTASAMHVPSDYFTSVQTGLENVALAIVGE
jgi:hypothetical protein